MHHFSHTLLLLCLLSVGVGTPVEGFNVAPDADASALAFAGVEGAKKGSDEFKTDPVDAQFPAFHFVFFPPSKTRVFKLHSAAGQLTRANRAQLTIRAPPLSLT